MQYAIARSVMTGESIADLMPSDDESRASKVHPLDRWAMQFDTHMKSRGI